MRLIEMKSVVSIAVGIVGIFAAGSCLGAEDHRQAPAREPVARLASGLERATFAGGCFWCMEPPFEKIDGVTEVISGFTGGPEANPTYKQVSSGATGHAEAVQITYDPKKVTYARLLEVFWHNIDPTTPNRQFVDAGRQYRSAIYYHSPEQLRLVHESKRQLETSGPFAGKKIVTEIVAASTFYPAEEYHQDFYKKDPVRYKSYRKFSGRDEFLERTWGKSR